MTDTITPVALPDLDTPPSLTPHADTAHALAAASIAPNTRRAYTTALGRLDTWLAATGVPLTDPALAEYLSELFETGKAPAVAALVVAAVKFRSKLTGTEIPVGPATARVLAGFRRAGRTRGRGQVEGVRWEQADAAAALAANGAESLAGLRDAAILAVASDALLRVSELAALTVADIDMTEQTITVQRSKTDQEGTGAVLFLGQPTLQRVQAWLAAAGMQAGPLFRALTKGGKVRSGLSARSIRTIIAKRSKAAGVPGRVSGHSLRVGAVPSRGRGLGRGDAAGGALEVAVYAGAVCPQTDGAARGGGPAALRAVGFPALTHNPVARMHCLLSRATA